MPKETNKAAKIVKANKFHKDTGFQFCDYNENSFTLSNKFSEVQFFSKTKCRFFKLQNGAVECHIPAWIMEQPKVKHFFRTK
jgi:hypothetical protein